ncbi:MAG: polysaccharide deacetylase family protein [Balneolaceae bacterium]
MKNISVLILVFSALLTMTAIAQHIDEPYEIGDWKDFKTAAISYTFDDNYPKQLDVVVPMFNEFGYKLTLFTFTNAWNSANWEKLSEAVEQGHEIGSHTATHNNLSEMNDDQQLEELAGSKETIEENIPGYKVHTIAYPFCVAGNNDLTRQYYIAARGCSGQIVPQTPSNFMDISSMIIGSEGFETSEALNGRADAAVSSGGWAVFLVHGLDGEGGYSELASEEIQGNLEYMADNDSNFWVGSFGNVFKYLRERNAASVNEISADENKIEVELTDTLDNSMYDHPITIRRLIPQDWDSVTVWQDTLLLKSRIIETGEGKRVQFNAIPDSGLIIIEKAMATSNEFSATDKAETFNLIRNYPNPFNPSTNIVFEVRKTGLITIEVYNTLGKKIETLFNEVSNPGTYTVKWDAREYVSGTYLYRYETDDISTTGKMILIK